jgi:hypothetical protein
MPKPDLVALTGGYRKTPVLQYKNHIYCDTRLIARVIDERFAGESIFPSELSLTANTIVFHGLPIKSFQYQLAMNSSKYKPLIQSKQQGRDIC